MFLLIAVGLAVVLGLYFLLPSQLQKVEGAVFVTGADSGMGEVTTEHLSKLGYHVFAGVFLESSFDKYADIPNVTPISLDVTSDESVENAVTSVEEELKKGSYAPGLVAVINCAGVAFTGPAEYLPLHQFKQQIQVNFLGYVAVTQAFLPLIKRAVSMPNARRGRVVLIGTGGGVPSPSPPLISAYMASKWAGEAFCQSLRLEMKMRKLPIDALMVNPGVVKPTKLMSGGMAILEKTWEKMPAKARVEYGGMVDAFIKFNEETPGTHPRYVALAMEKALSVASPPLRYKVGFDSKASPIVGLLPTPLKEWLLAKTMFKMYGWNGPYWQST